MKAIKHGKLFRVYALLDKNKNGTKNFFIGHMCGSKVAESVYQTLPRTQHNSIPNILDNNLRRNDWNYKKIISSNESLSGEKKRKKITKRLISFAHMHEKFNFTSTINWKILSRIREIKINPIFYRRIEEKEKKIYSKNKIHKFKIEEEKQIIQWRSGATKSGKSISRKNKNTSPEFNWNRYTGHGSFDDTRSKLLPFYRDLNISLLELRLCHPPPTSSSII